jgi:hypothetical protein
LDELDLALVRFQLGDFEWGGGYSNHGPMAAEALVALGHAALVPSLVDVYAPRLPELPPGEPIPDEEQAHALGRYERRGDWLATFEASIVEEKWRGTLVRWLPRLMAGLFGAAGHGMLRTAHAVRALSRDETPVRERELAFGLAYWASSFATLPGHPGDRARLEYGPTRMLREMPLVPIERRGAGFLSEAAEALRADDGFTRAIESIDMGQRTPELMLGDLCQEVARLYLAHPESRIAYAHALTLPSAYRLLSNHLYASPRIRFAGHLVQATAALHACYGRADAALEPVVSDELRRMAEDRAEIGYRAACSVEEHAIKLAEACLREDALSPHPWLRLAAADAAVSFGTSRGGRGG